MTKTTVCGECGEAFHDDETTRCECGVILCEDCTCTACYGDSDLDDEEEDGTDSWLEEDEDDDDSDLDDEDESDLDD